MEQLEGTMESLVFQSEDNQFCVFRMKSPTLGMVTAVYRGQAPFLGEMIRGAGEWVRHARFGQQFKLSSYQPVKPSSVTGMERFLSSGAVKGIGKTMAARIVEHFGTETMTVLESFPERLAEVPGIGAKKAEAIGQSYSEISDLRELMLFLEENGVSGNYAAKLQAAYGIRQSPGSRRTRISWRKILKGSVLKQRIGLPCHWDWIWLPQSGSAQAWALP